MPWGSSGISPIGSQLYPFRANVPAGKKQIMNKRIIVLVSLSSFLLISVCVGVVFIILKLKKLEQQPATTARSAVAPLTKRSGMLMFFFARFSLNARFVLIQLFKILFVIIKRFRAHFSLSQKEFKHQLHGIKHR